MPSRGAAGAPSFDPSSDPRSILGFFDDLDYCFEQANLVDDGLCKNHAVRYAPDSEKTIWRAFPEFTDATKTFEDFKKAVKTEYVGEDGVGLFSRRDLDLHVEATARTGVNAVSDFNVYSRRFRDIASFLVSGKQLQTTDRDHLFLHGLPDGMRANVLDRLRVTQPATRYPRDPYTIDQVTEAAHHVLEAAVVGGAPSSALLPSTVAAATPVKTELTQVMQSLASTIAAALLQTQQASANAQPVRALPPHLSLGGAPPPSNPTAARPLGPRTCFYCGDAAHSIRACPHVENDMTAGLVKRNDQGQVVLTNGSFVPNTFIGANLRERVQAYYRAHPEALQQPVAPQLLFQPVITPPNASVLSTAPSATTLFSGSLRDLDLDAQIESRRQELFALERQRATQQQRSVNSASSAEARTERARRRITPSSSIAPLPEDRPSPVATPSQPGEASSIPVAAPRMPEHPFADARDATYAPPTQRNFGAPPPRVPPTSTRKPDPAFRARPPIYNAQHVANVLKRCLEQPILVTKEELLSMSPEFCATTRELCTTRRIPTEPV
ncbi:hypothetical protein C8Q79DRAFT_891833, partial [Trametes meyenii]